MSELLLLRIECALVIARPRLVAACRPGRASERQEGGGEVECRCAMIIVVGAGVFGLSSALHLAQHGADVLVVEAGPLISGYDDERVVRTGSKYRGTSADTSRVVRPDYGSNPVYTRMMKRALMGWREWSQQAAAEGRAAPYHEVGFLLLRRGRDLPDSCFEGESRRFLTSEGFELRDLPPSLAAKFPAWAWKVRPALSEPGSAHSRPLVHRRVLQDVSGYLNPSAGWADCPATLSFMARLCRAAGVEIMPNSPVEALLVNKRSAFTPAPLPVPIMTCTRSRNHRRACTGVRLRGGSEIRLTTSAAGASFPWSGVVVAAGPWTPVLVPEAKPLMRPIAQPIFYMHTSDPALYRPERFPGASLLPSPTPSAPLLTSIQFLLPISAAPGTMGSL